MAEGPRGSGWDWEPVCPVADLEIGRGVSALVHGRAIAIFRVSDDEFHAVGNHDPLAKNSMLAKGIVGWRKGVPFVASLVSRQAFSLLTGRCLDDPDIGVPSYRTRILDGLVWVAFGGLGRVA